MEKKKTLERYVNWVVNQKWIVLAISLVILISAGAGLRNLGFKNNYRIFFSDENPQLNALDRINSEFNESRNVYIAIEDADGNIFTKSNLQAIKELETLAWLTPHSTRVDAISNYQHTYANGDELIIESLVPDALELDITQIEHIKGIALSEKNIRGRLVSIDGSMAGINVLLNTNPDSTHHDIEVIAYARKIAADLEENYPNLSTYITGQSAISISFGEAAKADGKTLIPVMILVILIVSYFVTRNIGSTIYAFLTVLLSVIAGLGIAGWLGYSFNALSASAPTIILTLAIADSIHILISFLTFFRKGDTKSIAVKKSIILNFKAIFFTSLTTIIGFLTLNLNDSPPFHDLGNISALGVACAFIFSIFTLPALLAVTPFRNNTQRSTESTTTIDSLLGKLSVGLLRNKQKVVVGYVIISFAFIAFSFTNVFNDNYVKYFSPEIQFRSDTDHIMEKMTGIYNIDFNLTGGDDQSITNPLYLKLLNEFEEWLLKQENVTHVLGVHEVVKRVNKSMHGDDESYFVIPENSELASQYLLVYEMSVPYGLDLSSQINLDKSSSKFSILVGNISSIELLHLTKNAEQWLQDNAPLLMNSTGASVPIMFAHLGQRQTRGMVQGGVIALIVISILLIIFLRSGKLGIMSLIPNLLPVFFAFGFWGFFIGEVNSATAMVFGMTLGVIVDDTVHMLVKYKYARRKLGYEISDAVHYATISVGKAIIATSLILFSGFTVLGFSNFEMNSAMGQMSGLVIIAALILDLSLLPVLIYLIEKKKQLIVNRSKVSKKIFNYKLKLQAMKKYGSIIIGVILVLSALISQAQNQGLEIAKESYNNEKGFQNYSVNVSMLLSNGKGKVITRNLVMKVMEENNDGNKSLMEFENPSDVKGTVVLTFTHKLKDDDQWLYLPALGRVKRISSSSKSGSFLGSEFAFEDLASPEVEKYTFKFLEETIWNTIEVYMVERIPVDRKSGYSKQLVYYNKDNYRVEKIEYFDRKGEHVKTLEITGYKVFDIGIPKPAKLTMKNQKNGKTTSLNFVNYKFKDSAIRELDFTPTGMKGF